jgi:hypothetical protein
MTGLCDLPLDFILWTAFAFLAASLLLGALSAIRALRAGPAPAAGGNARVLGLDGQPIGPILEVLKGLIEALGKAPAWFALFLAGLFLFWLAGETYVDACKPAAPVVTSTTTKTITITRTVPPTRQPDVQPNPSSAPAGAGIRR